MLSTSRFHPAKRTLAFLLPSFLQSSSPPLPRKIHPTAYLDGLRGLAALVVFFYHFTGYHFKHFIPYYGTPLSSDGSPGDSYMIQQPFLRLIFSGRCMVHLFFVVSGYALSLKPLKQIRARQFGSLLSTLSSSILRRFVRLYLPLYISSFFGLLLGLLGLKQMEETTFVTRVQAWFHAMYFYSDFWNISNFSGLPIDMHLWTIPLEMAFSMVLFIVLIGLSRVQNSFRMGAMAIIASYCLFVQQWAAAEFLLGGLLAEIGLVQDSWKDVEFMKNPKALSPFEKQNLTPTHTFSPERVSHLVLRLRDSATAKRALQLFCVGNLIIALWLMGWPDKYSDSTPSWIFLSTHTPSLYRDKGLRSIQFFWHCISSLQVVFACQQLPFLQSILTSRIPRYLGKISFALYLTHISVLTVLGPRIMPYIVWWIEGRWQVQGKGGGLAVYLVSGVIVTMVQIWVADIFCKEVDVRCVRIARKLEDVIGIREDKLLR